MFLLIFTLFASLAKSKLMAIVKSVQMLSTVTLNCQVKIIVMNSGSQLSKFAKSFFGKFTWLYVSSKLSEYFETAI